MDLNRNFPEGYGVGASKNPCSEVYQGPKPFSEVLISYIIVKTTQSVVTRTHFQLESNIIKNYIKDVKNIKAAVSVHSYGSVLIYPWGYRWDILDTFVWLK